MAISGTSYPFQSGSGTNVGESQWRLMAGHWAADGFCEAFDGVPTDPWQVTISSGLTLNVGAGRGFIRGVYCESSAATVTCATASPSNPRYDRVVARLDMTDRNFEIDVVTGTAAVSPTVPALTQTSTIWEIPLATITVAAGDTSLASGDIADERYRSCQRQGAGGIVHNGYISYSSDQTSISTSATLLTGLTVTISTNGRRRLRVRGKVHAILASGDRTTFGVNLYDANGIITGAGVQNPISAACRVEYLIDHIADLAAGRHTFTLYGTAAGGSSGTVTISNSTHTGLLWVEDVGPIPT